MSRLIFWLCAEEVDRGTTQLPVSSTARSGAHWYEHTLHTSPKTSVWVHTCACVHVWLQSCMHVCIWLYIHLCTLLSIFKERGTTVEKKLHVSNYVKTSYWLHHCTLTLPNKFIKDTSLQSRHGGPCLWSYHSEGRSKRSLWVQGQPSPQRGVPGQPRPCLKKHKQVNSFKVR